MTTIRNIGEHERTRNIMLRIGTVTEPKPANGTASVLLDEVATAQLPVLMTRGGQDREFWMPAPGEQVMVFCPDGEPSNGCILGGVWRDQYPAPRKGDEHATVYRDTAVQQYNPATGVYHIELPETVDDAGANGENPDPADLPMVVITAPVILLRTNMVLRAPYERTFTDQALQSREDYNEPAPIGQQCC